MIYLLTSVDTPPEKEGWYWVKRPFDKGTASYEDGKWVGDGLGAVTHYLRPLSEEKVRLILEDLVFRIVHMEDDLETSITNAIKALKDGK